MQLTPHQASLRTCKPQNRVATNAPRRSRLIVRSQAETRSATTDRRNFLASSASLALLASNCSAVNAALPVEPETRILCDDACKDKLGQIERVRTASGLEYQDIVVGEGAAPLPGYQVVVDYVAMLNNGRVFDSSVEKGKPYDIRVGSGQVIAGLDEGILGMRSGGFRRIYIPGDLSFPQGLKAAAGRPSVPAKTPVMFDVKLLYVPGLDE